MTIKCRGIPSKIMLITTPIYDCELCHTKTGLKIFFVVIQKEGLACECPTKSLSAMAFNMNQTWKLSLSLCLPSCCGHIVNSQKFPEITLGAKGLNKTVLKWHG